MKYILLLKFYLGGLRVGVSNELLKESLSKIGSRSKEEIEENWYGFSFPYYGFFQWLEGKNYLKNLTPKICFIPLCCQIHLMKI